MVTSSRTSSASLRDSTTNSGMTCRMALNRRNASLQRTERWVGREGDYWRREVVLHAGHSLPNVAVARPLLLATNGLGKLRTHSLR